MREIALQICTSISFAAICTSILAWTLDTSTQCYQSRCFHSWNGWYAPISMLKKSSSFLSVYGSLQSCAVCSPPQCGSKSSTSSHHRPIQQTRSYSTRHNKPRETQPWTSRRQYATVRDAGGMDFRDNMNWPCRKSTGQNPFIPSPYEIFDMHKSTNYGKATKMKYFELVKIYHPDRSSHHAGCEGLSHMERLERVSEETILRSQPHR